MKTINKVLNVLFGILLIVFMLIFVNNNQVLFKVLTSVCFVLTGAIAIDFKNTKSKWFPLLIEAGLILSLGGDWSIYYNFVAGAAFFALAHFAYIAAYFKVRSFKSKDLIYAVPLFIAACLVINLMPFLQLDISMRLVCMIYSFVISCMTGKAISNFLADKNKLNLIICIGAVMFFISDIMVLFNSFNVDANMALTCKHIGHFIYFPGQYVLAQSIREYNK